MTPLLDWLNMSGYSLYIWPAYGLVALVLIANCLSIQWHKQRIRQHLKNWFKR